MALNMDNPRIRLSWILKSKPQLNKEVWRVYTDGRRLTTIRIGKTHDDAIYLPEHRLKAQVV
jgi:hypothetical protein